MQILFNLFMSLQVMMQSVVKDVVYCALYVEDGDYLGQFGLMCIIMVLIALQSS